MPTYILTTPAPVGSPGQALWTDTTLVPTPPSGPASGDLSGNYPNPLVVGFNGIPIDTGAPANGDVLTYNNLTNQWEHSPIIGGGGPPVGPAGGDLGGLYPNPTVVGLQTNPVDPAAPNANDALVWDGAKWTPTPVGNALTAIYGQFYDLTDQPLAANVITVIQIALTAQANGVSMVGGTQMTVAQAGVYEFNISLQMYHTGGTPLVVTLWLRKNGANVPDSASSFEMGNNNNRTIPFVPVIISMNAGDYIEWVAVSNSDTPTIEHFPGSGVPPNDIPAIPSVIASAKLLGL